MKFNEPFEQPSNPEENFHKEIERIIALAQKNIDLYNIISSKLEEQDPETIDLIRALLKEKVFKKIHKDLETKLDELTEKSEELIESPNSEDPDVKEKRKKIADQINEMLEKQEEFKPLINEIMESKFVIDSSSKEEIKKAEGIIAELKIEIDSLESDRRLN